jgi:anaphase-promoting complex subunit 1
MNHENRYLTSNRGLSYNTDIIPLCIENVIGEESLQSKFKVKLYDGKQKLFIFEKVVIWISGGFMVRTIKLETPIIASFFTVFEGQKYENNVNTTKNGFNSDEKALVIVLDDQIRVYDKSKSVLVVSFPIHIQSAFPFHTGIVIGKKPETIVSSDLFCGFNKLSSLLNDPIESEYPYSTQVSATYSMKSSYNNSLGSAASTSAPYTESNFLTLTDPIGELGSIVSSSTSSFSPMEQLILYPDSTSSLLAATYNSLEDNISIYYVRYLSRSKNSKSKTYSGIGNLITRKNSKRSTSSSGAMINSAASRTLDDDAKHWRSTSNPLSYDRMASGTEHIPESSGMYSYMAFEGWNLRKDVIFTKIHNISVKTDFKNLKIFILPYKDKEAIVLVNLKLHLLDIYIFDKSSNQVNLSKYKNTITLQGLDATKFDVGQIESSYIIILKNSHEFVLYNPFYNLYSPSIKIPLDYTDLVSIDDVNNYEISFMCKDFTHYSIHLQAKPQDSHVNNYIHSLKYLSHDLIYENFWLHWCSMVSLNIPYCDDWKLYVVTLLSVSLPESANLDIIDTSLNEITELLPYVNQARVLNRSNNSGTFSTADLSLEALLPKIVLSLHIIREDSKLNVLAKNEYDRLSILISQLVHWMCWSNAWQIYYNVDLSKIDHKMKISLAEYIPEPPNIMASLGSLFSNNLIPYITFSIIAGEDDFVDKITTPRTYNILRLFEVIVSLEFENLDLIRTMVSFNIDASELETYPPGIYFIFKNTIELCQKKLKLNWNVTREELKLIGRNDLLYLDSEKSKSTFININKKLAPKSTKDMISDLSNNEVLNAWDGQAEADKFHVTRLIFSEDRRFYELTKLLQTSKVQTITYELNPKIDDYEKLIYQRSISAKIALRTLTTPIGRGAVFNSSRKPLVTEGFPIPIMNFNTLILPDNVNVTLEKDTIPDYLLDWGYFHNGASAGLSVSKGFNGISGSWIAFNRPPVLNAQHAGFLLGLGLNGHLKQLEEWHIYNYLGPKHEHTSIGLLIGIAASLKGTMDIKMTKVLSVHVVAFLPPGSTNLNVQLSVQTAGIIGIGLIYLETQHRRMSEVLLAQISSTLIIHDKKVVSEGYQLAAGFALGYINLSKGDQMLTATDNHIIDSLISYGTSIRDVQTLKELDKSCSGAVMALTFMFLKTNNCEIAAKLNLPKTIQLLEYVRPDLLMLRCLAKNMVMWNSIEPTKAFVEEQVPICISKKFAVETITVLDIDILPYINILSGALLSISLCFASTANLEAKETLLYYFDIFLNLGSIEPANYDSKVSLSGVRNARDVTILGLSIIMAGTGDLDVMRRLRYLQGVSDEYTKYGNYMAINMSLGFLFLGGGQQAFDTNNNFSIAALITSIYPMFGSNNYEAVDENDINKSKFTNEVNDLHLQALRHFWALSVENRCLVVREIDNEKPVKVDIDVFLKNKAILKVPSPCLLPDLSLINKISVHSNNLYFPVEFDLIRSTNSSSEKFKKKLTLYVDKKASYKTLKLNFIDKINIDEEMKTLKLTEENARSVNCLKNLNIFNNLKPFEKDILFESSNNNDNKLLTTFTVFDFKYEIEKIVNNDFLINEEKLSNLKLIFSFVDSVILINDNKDLVKRKRRKTKKYLGSSNSDTNINGNINDNNNNNNLDTFFNLDSGGEEFNGNNNSNRGLHFLNVEFIEKLKKELFSKLGD